MAHHHISPTANAQDVTGTTLFREIDALGGTPSSDWDEGYNEALSDVLQILTKRGFTEYADFDPTEEGSGLDPRTPEYGVGR
jgi:hypothetical protein